MSTHSIETYTKAIELHKQYGSGARRLSKTLGIPHGTVTDWLYRGAKPKVRGDLPLCVYCGSENVKKDGRRFGNLKQMFLCKDCNRRFSLRGEEAVPPKFNPTDLGWLAGIVDGEGTLTLCKRYNPEMRRGFQWTIAAHISNTSLDLLGKASKLLANRPHAYTKKKPTPKNWKDCYILVLNPNIAREILPLLIPHLTAKKRQAELLVEALKLMRENVWWQVGGTAQNDKRLEEIYLEIRRLNKRGKLYV